VIYSDEVIYLRKYDTSFDDVIEQDLQEYDPIPLNHSLQKNVLLSHMTSDYIELHCLSLYCITDESFMFNLASTVGYDRTNVIGSRTSFVIASVRTSIH